MKRQSLALLGLLIILISLFVSLSQPTTAQEMVVPVEPPDAEVGLAIFAERCAVCHGQLGAGDGEQALAAGLEPRDFSNPDYRLETNPQLMFEVITNGSMMNGMPPFGPGTSNPLSEADRWDLIAAIYSFGTPKENIDLGETLFAGVGGDINALPDVAYWFTHTNNDALADMDEGKLGITAVSLSEEEKEALVDYGRAQSYNYVNPLAAFEPIEAATITGVIVNGSTTEPLAGAETILRAFSRDFSEAMVMTTTTNVDGQFTFELTDVPPDWIFLANTEYNDLTFNGPANQLSRQTPELSMPIIVYDSTDDASVVSIEQIHMILNFIGDQVQISELYVFSNEANAVFAGESGDPEEGTIELHVPAGATNVDFQRAFGSLENFGPAPEVIQTETGWADTVPLRPGSGTTSLLVSYNLRYDEDLLLAHPLSYETTGATIIFPDTGVELSGEGWQSQGTQTLPGGNFAAYVNSSMSGADALSLELNGRPQQTVDAQGNAILVRDDNQELMIGLAALGLAMVAGVFVVRSWQQPTVVADAPSDQRALLKAIADLDDEYEAGEVGEGEYRQEREQLKEELKAIWSNGE